MTEPEAAWLAGLLEGEGTFMLDHKYGKSRVRIQVTMSDEDILWRIVEVTGLGNVWSLPETDRLGKKPLWYWRINKKADIRELLRRIKPYMGVRRGERISEMLEDLANIIIRPEGICTRGHAVTGDNRQWVGSGWACKRCIRERRKESYQREKLVKVDQSLASNAAL